MTPEQITALVAWATENLAAAQNKADTGGQHIARKFAPEIANWQAVLGLLLASPDPHGDAGLREQIEAMRANQPNKKDPCAPYWIGFDNALADVLALLDAPPTAAQARPTREQVADAWWRGRSSVRALPFTSATTPQLRAQCESDLSALFDSPPAAVPENAMPCRACEAAKGPR